MRRLIMMGLALGASLAAGCGSEGRTVSERSADLERVPLARLPDLPGCAMAMPTMRGTVSLREIADDAALYVVYLGATPVCVDDLQGVFGASFLSDEDIARAFDGTPLPARASAATPIDDGTPLPAQPSASNEVGDGTPLPAHVNGEGDLTKSASAQTSNPTVGDGTPLPARGDGTSTGGSSSSKDDSGGAP